MGICCARSGRADLSLGQHLQSRGCELAFRPPYATGEKDEWVSWVGAYDLAGGIAEWVDGWFAPYGETQAGAESGLRVVRGGHWFSRTAYLWRGAAREPLVPDYMFSTVGFRCALDYGDVVSGER